MLENVSNLKTVGSDCWNSLCTRLERDEGFVTSHAILNSLEFGLQQERKRLYLVGRRDGGSIHAWTDTKSWLPRAATRICDILDA